MTPLEVFRVVAAAFAAVDDGTVQTRPACFAEAFGKARVVSPARVASPARVVCGVWVQPLALLTAHRMQLAGVGADSGDNEGGGSVIDELGGAAVISKIASYSSGGESISFYHGGSSGASADSEFELTEYGVQYLTLQKMYTIPIINAGEARC